MTEPYYEDDLVMLYHGDVFEVLSGLNPGLFDVAFCDPPFNVGVKYNSYHDKRPDYTVWCERWLGKVFHTLNPFGSIYLMTISRHLEALYPLLGERGHFINHVTWMNGASTTSKRQFWLAGQPILVYGKSDQYHFHTYAQTVTPAKVRWGGYKTEAKGQMPDVWQDIPFVYAGSITHREAILLPGSKRKKHPAQMPEGLAHRAIAFSCPEDGTVLDPFAGSGTTLRVAQMLGVQVVGIELDEMYCEMIANRCRQPYIPLSVATDENYKQEGFDL